MLDSTEPRTGRRHDETLDFDGGPEPETDVWYRVDGVNRVNRIPPEGRNLVPLSTTPLTPSTPSYSVPSAVEKAIKIGRASCRERV